MPPFIFLIYGWSSTPATKTMLCILIWKPNLLGKSALTCKSVGGLYLKNCSLKPVWHSSLPYVSAHGRQPVWWQSLGSGGLGLVLTLTPTRGLTVGRGLFPPLGLGLTVSEGPQASLRCRSTLSCLWRLQCAKLTGKMSPPHLLWSVLWLQPISDQPWECGPLVSAIVPETLTHLSGRTCQCVYLPSASVWTRGRPKFHLGLQP